MKLLGVQRGAPFLGGMETPHDIWRTALRGALCAGILAVVLCVVNAPVAPNARAPDAAGVIDANAIAEQVKMILENVTSEKIVPELGEQRLAEETEKRSISADDAISETACAATLWRSGASHADLGVPFTIKRRVAIATAVGISTRTSCRSP